MSIIYEVMNISSMDFSHYSEGFLGGGRGISAIFLNLKVVTVTKMNNTLVGFMGTYTILSCVNIY